MRSGKNSLMNMPEVIKDIGKKLNDIDNEITDAYYDIFAYIGKNFITLGDVKHPIHIKRMIGLDDPDIVDRIIYEIVLENDDIYAIIKKTYYSDANFRTFTSEIKIPIAELDIKFRYYILSKISSIIDDAKNNQGGNNNE